MKEFTFIVDGEPKGKARARTFMDKITGKNRSATPIPTVNYENWVKICFKQKYRSIEPIKSAINLKIWAYFQIPASISNAKKQAMKDHKIRPVKKPDCDNILKSVSDALNGIAYLDDKQVAMASIGKFYSEKPFIKVVISEID